MITLPIILSEQCNLNCTYCGVDKLSKNKIDPKIFLTEFYKIKNKNPNEIVRIDFHGGEPLIQWDSIVEIILETKNEQNTKYFMHTNGLLLNEERVDFLNFHNVQVSLSFDGLWQDLNRPQFGNKGSLSQYLAKLPVFKKLNDPKCHSMIYKNNFNLLENHLYILRTLGINPDLTLVRDVGIWDLESTDKICQAFSEMIDWYIENIEHEVMPGIIKDYMGHILLYASKKHSVENCGAGLDVLYFVEDKIKPCIRFKDQDSIDKIDSFRRMEKCQTCEVKNYCRKGCLYENIKNDGPIDELCTMYKHFYKEITEMLKSLNTNEKFRSVLKEAIANEY